MKYITLKSSDLKLVLDPHHGADILSIKTVPTGEEVLYATPWSDRAEAVLANEQTTLSYEPVAHWMERYRGGWQTLVPNAGPARDVHGAPLGFHGEASISSWKVLKSEASSIQIQLDLFSVPVRIERVISLKGNEIFLTDVVTNTSPLNIEVDYSSHPAFGGALLEGEVHLETSAQEFHLDEERDSPHGPAASVHQWPLIKGDNGSVLDLSKLPAPDKKLGVFGWISAFEGPKWYRVKNKEKNITFELQWESEYLNFAWFWLEFNNSEGFPWFGKVRTFAIEPSSTKTSGKTRRSLLQMKPHQSVEIKQKVIITF
jgi:hypothetical protein